MDTDQLIMMGAICVIVYIAGYRAIAIGMLILMVVASVITPTAKKAAPYGGVKVRGAEMLEPIVIETTKGAPFRIPAKMKIRMNPYWGATPWHAKIGKRFGADARGADLIVALVDIPVDQ